MNKLSTTWELAKVSWNVLRSDKELLLLPILSAISAILVSVVCFAPLVWVPAILGGGQGGAIAFLGLLPFYFINYFVVIFFNTALIGAATIRLRGGNPTLGGALAFAWENVSRIAQWAVVAATVGTILRMIEQRVGWLGKVVVAVLGATWSTATYFVIPVLVYEHLGPIDALKQSTAMFRKTWGEQTIGAFSFGLLFFVLASPVLIVPLAVGAMLDWATLLTLLALAWVYWTTLLIVLSALNGIFVAALYQYARSGQAFGPFTPQLLNAAWRPGR